MKKTKHNQSFKNLSKRKKERKKIVICHGVFDILHVGHIKHFQEAKSLGDILIVSVTSDKFVNKGPGRPAFNENNRLDSIIAIGVVDYVVLNNNSTATILINDLKPNIYCKGPDYKDFSNDVTGEIKNEIKAIKKVGGKIFYTSGKTFSSSTLINRFTNIISDNQKRSLIKKKK